MSMTVVCVAPGGAWAVVAADRRQTHKLGGAVVSRTDRPTGKLVAIPCGAVVTSGDRMFGAPVERAIHQRQPDSLAALEWAVRGALETVRATGYESTHPVIVTVAAAVWDGTRWRGWLFDAHDGTAQPAPCVIALPTLYDDDRGRIEQTIDGTRRTGSLTRTVHAVRSAFAEVASLSEAVSPQFDYLIREGAYADHI